jgi:hypothetical protein
MHIQYLKEMAFQQFISMLVVPLKLIYSSIQVFYVLVLTVRRKLINFVYQIFPLVIPKISADFTFCIVQSIPIYFTLIL